MIMRKLFFCLALLMALGFATVAAPRVFADDPGRSSKLTVSVWPEYDQPSVLVMYDGTLADASNLPREISVLVPANAALLVTTYANADGTLASEQPSKTASAGDGYTRVTYTVKAADYHVEYYDNGLRGGPDKTLDFAFKAAAPVDQVTLDFQQPLKASNFTLTPPQTGTRSENGFNYQSVQFSNVTPGQVLTTQVKYTKSDPSPSVSSAPAVSAPAAVPQAGASSNNLSSIYLIVALVIVGLFGVIGFLILQQRSNGMVPVAVGPSRKARSKRASAGQRGGASVFCTQCGHTLRSDDNFCPKCGAHRKAG